MANTSPKQNPDNPCPPDILAQIESLEVQYRNFEGRTKTGVIEVNAKAVADVALFFQKAMEIGFPIERVVRSSDAPYLWDDQKLMAANATSGFNYRPVAGTDNLSKHGLGLAIDVNTRLNPCIRYQDGKRLVNGKELAALKEVVWDPSLPGTLYSDHPLVRYMLSLGWEWGGHWTLEKDGLVDYQHFTKDKR